MIWEQSGPFRQRAEELAKRVDKLEAQQTERGLVLTLGDVLFGFDKATLKPGGKRVVDNLYKFMKEYLVQRVMIEGFTDNFGPADYNKQLSKRRANAVRKALMERDTRTMRIQIRGLWGAVSGGQGRPLVKSPVRGYYFGRRRPY